MKFLIMTVFSLCVGLCCREEDDTYSYSFYQINNNAIVSIDNNQNNFFVGDDIYITSTINYIQNTNTNEIINLNQLGILNFQYNLKLYKLTAYGTLSEIPLTENDINIIAGDVTIDNYTQALNVLLMDEAGVYQNHFNFTLLSPGTYYLGANKSDNNYPLFISNYNDTEYHIRINSEITNANTNGLYEFTVN